MGNVHDHMLEALTAEFGAGQGHLADYTALYRALHTADSWRPGDEWDADQHDFWEAYAIAPAASYSAAVLADNPFAYWKMNETSGTTIIDYGTNGGLSATYSGGTIAGSTVAGPADGVNALDFDGVDDFIHIGDNDSLSSSDHTLELWAFADTIGVNGTVPFSKRDVNTAAEWHIVFVNNDTAYTEVMNTTAGDYLIAQGACTDGAWHHIVGTMNGSTNTLILYVDGVAVTTDTTTNGTRRGNSAASVEIGRQELATAHNYFDGKICQVAYYTTVLSAARVLAHYTAMTS